MKAFFAALTRSRLGMLGAALTTVSAVLIVTLFALEIVGFVGSPYLGILAYLILPAFFLMGLALMPLGVWRQRRAEERHPEKAGGPEFPVIDFNRQRVRRFGLFFLGLTAVNLVILSVATYKGVHTMETREFCGTTCHVMEPEYTAYQASPHARVQCVECHIGPGASWFVKSKLSGAWQVVSVNFDLYPTPIPTPIHNLRPARETCEQCHWPSKFIGDRLKVIPHYAEDEENTLSKTVLLLRVGGVHGRESQGIHWHVDPDHQIRYLSSEDREEIYTVEMTLPDGTRKVYENGEPPADTETAWRTMDCVDCHNRPSHTFEPAERALDKAMADGRIDPSLPFMSREALRLLTAEYESRDAAKTAIVDGLKAYYAENHPELAESRAEAIDRSAEGVAGVYGRNVFPHMNVAWNTYPNHIGHQNTPGCFRCHDDEHETADGETISQDCDTCHTLLAMEEEEPEILEQLQP